MKRFITNKTRKIFSIMLVFAMLVTAVLPGVSVTAQAAEGLAITESSGWLESAYAKWSPVTGAIGYRAYVKKAGADDSAYVKLDNELIRQYADYWRVDAVGLAAGSYVIKVEAVMDGTTLTAETAELEVSAHDRSGFAFSAQSPLKTGSGAYNEDGTLRSDAQVVYVTAATAKTVTATVNGTKVTGFQAILDAKQKKGTSNDVIDFRIIGCIKLSDLDKISSSAEGLQVKGAAAYTAMNITIEGIGDDATISGFGFLIRNCGNVELRNFAVMNCLDDSVSVDTSNCNLWIHNLDLFYGQAGGDSDQAKGDGSVDIKKSQYCTVSYNHFWDSGKSCLIDASKDASSGSDYLTYHHNWFDHSDSRHPRVRNGSNFHIYNNYYDGNAKYGVGVTTGSSTFVEANYFRNCKYPMMSSLQGTDKINEDTSKDGVFSGEAGGMIKAYNNYMEGHKSFIPYSENNDSFDAYVAETRDEQVPSSAKTYNGGTTYSNFDTASTMYTYTPDSPKAAKVKVEKYAGRVNGGDFKWVFDNATEDENYSVIKELKAAVVAYSSSVVSIGGIGGSSVEEPTTEAPTGTDPTEGTTGSTENPTTAPTPSTGSKVHNFTTNGKDSSFYTITGNLSTSKGTVTYNGLTLTQCLKLESSSSITFTAAADGELTLVFVETSKNRAIKYDEKAYSSDASGIVTIPVKAGSHTLKKGDTANLFYMSLVYDGETDATEAPTEAPTQAPTEAPTETPTEAPVDDTPYVGDVNTELQKFTYDSSNNYISGQIVVVEWVDTDGDGVKESTVPKYAPTMKFVSTDGTESIDVFVTATGTNTYYFDRLLAGLTEGKEYMFEVTAGNPYNVSDYKTVPIYTGSSAIGSEGNLGKAGSQNIMFKTGADGTLRLYGQMDYYNGNVNSLLTDVSYVKSENGDFVSGHIVVTEWINGVSTVPATTPTMTFEAYDGSEVNSVFIICEGGSNTYYFDRNLNGEMDVTKEYIFRITLTESNNVSQYKSMVVTTNEMSEKSGVLWSTDTQTIMYKTVAADGDNQLRVYAVNK